MGAVSTSNLTRKFGDLIAVNSINLDVSEGTIFGLLGPNGAGKSTTVRLLCTLLKPSSGTASVLSYDVIEDPGSIRHNIGVVTQGGGQTLYSAMSVYENLEYFARLHGVAEEEIPSRIEEFLTFMGLWDRKDDPAGALSTGNQQRLALCRALLHKPKVLLLDEPTSALDPVAAKRVRELILNTASRYKQTFFINSHNLAEVQRICDRIAIIDEGKILLIGETAKLRKKLRTKQEFLIRVGKDLQKAEGIVKSADFVESVTAEFDTLRVTIQDPFENNQRLIRSLLDVGINVIEFSEEEVTLEDLYLEVIKGGGD